MITVDYNTIWYRAIRAPLRLRQQRISRVPEKSEGRGELFLAPKIGRGRDVSPSILEAKGPSVLDL